MNTNILVKPIYKHQRAQSSGTSESNISNTLYVPMGIRIGRVGLYADMPNLNKSLSANRLQSLIKTFADKSLYHISVTLSDRRILIAT
jgi:hypothetical protein